MLNCRSLRTLQEKKYKKNKIQLFAKKLSNLNKIKKSKQNLFQNWPHWETQIIVTRKAYPLRKEKKRSITLINSNQTNYQQQE